MNYLFPNKLKNAGLIIFFIGIILGLLNIFIVQNPSFLDVKTLTILDKPIMGEMSYFKFTQNNMFDELIALMIILGGLISAFSKEKYEDEFIAKIRLDSLVWATYCNYFILIVSILFFYGLPFFWVLVFNMFTTLIIFLLKFNLTLSKLRKNQQS